jgi:serine/threonine protein kinase
MNFIINEKGYKYIKTIGFGAHANIFEVVNEKENDNSFVLKKSREIEFNILLEREWIIGNFLNYNGINTHIIDFCKTEREVLLLEKKLHKSMNDRLREAGVKLSFETTLLYSFLTLKIINSFHKIGVIHGDIKPNNFMDTVISNDLEGISKEIVLIDFELCIIYSKKINPFLEAFKKQTNIVISESFFQNIRSSLHRYSSVSCHKKKVYSYAIDINEVKLYSLTEKLMIYIHGFSLLLKHT